MSLEMVMILVSEEQVEYLRSMPAFVEDFLTGNRPTTEPGFWRRLLGEKPTTIPPPFPWPTRPPKGEYVGVNHRSVVIFHFLLNGTEAHVAGHSSIFESWNRPELCLDVCLTQSCVGLTPTQVRELLRMVQELSPDIVKARWNQYFASHPEHGNPELDEYYPECLESIREACQKAVSEGAGVLVTAV